MLQLLQSKIEGSQMKKLNLSALVLGAALFTGVGVTSANAEDMKCGAGKCGSAMAKPAKVDSKCGAEKKAENTSKKCGAEKKVVAKCGTGKCGDAKDKPAPKCGGNK